MLRQRPAQGCHAAAVHARVRRGRICVPRSGVCVRRCSLWWTNCTLPENLAKKGEKFVSGGLRRRARHALPVMRQRLAVPRRRCRSRRGRLQIKRARLSLGWTNWMLAGQEKREVCPGEKAARARRACPCCISAPLASTLVRRCSARRPSQPLRKAPHCAGRAGCPSTATVEPNAAGWVCVCAQQCLLCAAQQTRRCAISHLQGNV